MSTTTKRPLKRLSLLQSPSSQSPQPSPALCSPNFSQRSKRVSLADLKLNAFENPLQSPASSISSPASRSGFPKASRRQSSIYYVSRDREVEREQRSTPDTTSPQERQSFTPELRDEESTEKAAVGEDGTIDLTEFPVDAITLAEKHADLLRFIAQKESKCLELRSQLSIQETELATLKRKWERIVHRSLKTGSTTSVTSESDGAVFNGFKGGMQGVGRLLAQLGELSVNSPNTSSDAESSHASHSSISTNFTSSSGRTHFSQSSVSSFGIAEEEPSELMKISPRSRGSTPSPWPISTASHHRSGSTAVRRRPYEPSSPSSASPLTTPYSGTSFGSTHTLPHSATIKISPLQAPKQTKAWQPKHSKRVSTSDSDSNSVPGVAAGSFPPVSSIPGASAAPLINWVDSVSKKLTQQHTSQSLQKRASTILTDASNTLFAAWASPGKVAFSPQETRVASPAFGCLSSPSLLDDDSDLTLSQSSPVTKALEPDRPSPVLKPDSSPRCVPVARASTIGKPETTPSEADSEEWNW